MRLTERPGVRLESIPGLVHGIVSEAPHKIQCDKCLVVQWGDSQRPALQIMFSDITFNPRRYAKDSRRLCGECRKEEWSE